MNNRLFTLVILLLVILTSGIIGCGGKKNVSHLSPQELFTYAVDRYENGKYLRAIELFQTVIYNYAGENVVDSAQYYLAMSYYENGEHQLATVEFNRLAVNYPSSVFFEEAVFMRAVAIFEGTPDNYALDQSETIQAIKRFEDFIIDFPESKKVPEAQKFILEGRTRLANKYYDAAVVYSRIGAYKASEKYCQFVIDDYTDTEYAALATFLSGEMEYKMKNYDRSREMFENFIAVFAGHEKTLKAQERIIESAFKAAKREFENDNFEEAASRFDMFKKDFPNNGKVKKADKFLEKIQKNKT